MSGHLDPATLAAFAAAALVAFVGIVLAYGLTNGEKRRMKQRFARAAGQGAPRRAPATAAPYASLRRDASNGRLRRLDDIAHKVLPRPQALRERLSRTGRKISLGQYALICLGAALAETVARPLFVPLAPATAILVAIVAGLGLPHLAVSFLIKRRLKRFTAQFPDAIDLIVRGLKSGLPTTESIRIVAEEFGDPIGVEFQRISDQVRFGQTLEDALWDTAKRLDTAEFRFFCISLSVQRETGGNLGETLENLSDILRKRRQMQLKIRAMSSEAKSSAAILGSLPFIMFVLLYFVNGPYVKQLLTDPRGMTMLGIGLSSLALGVFVMIRMTKFPI